MPAGNNQLNQSVTPAQSGSQYALGYSGPTVSVEPMAKGGGVTREVVTYTDSGFAPTPLTVSAGTTVTFVNESSHGMWVASDIYPTDQLLPGLNAHGLVAKSGTYEYTFTNVGTWRYHNDANPHDVGSIVVAAK
ncbi:MAG TPA: hypothetical protein VMR81_02935 [Patescibacteria group bacterium]|nr:hypothetical protein [Patescibacteria group bacterium]